MEKHLSFPKCEISQIFLSRVIKISILISKSNRYQLLDDRLWYPILTYFSIMGMLSFETFKRIIFQKCSQLIAV